MYTKQIIMFLFAIAMLGSQVQILTAQTGQGAEGKHVQVATETLLDPVWIIKVAIGNQFLLAPYDARLPHLSGQVMPGQMFSAGDDWLKGMTIYVMNRTNKPVAWLDIAIRFPQAGNGRTRPARIFEIKLGRMPDADAIYGNGNPIPAAFMGTKPLNLQPGATLAIHVSDHIDKMQAYVGNAMPLTEINECYIYVSAAEFDGGLRYAGGGYSLPDTQHPGQWHYLPARQYFPGNAHQYLPNVVK